MQTPILFLIFNRLDTATKVFERIREVTPARLFIAADGPREQKSGEKEKCEEVRNTILGMIDWDCELKTFFREENLGCRMAVSSAIDWFFDHVEEGIILEDDCLPSISFFSFCSVLLEKYRNDDRIGIISGDNFLSNKIKIKESYYFSKFPYIWGWATWKRVWKLYDVDMLDWVEVKKNKDFNSRFQGVYAKFYYHAMFDLAFQRRISTWDYQFLFMNFKHNLINVIPKKNLVKNIGFSKTATHTKSSSKFIDINHEELEVIKFNEYVETNYRADKITFNLLIKRNWKNLFFVFGLHKLVKIKM